MSFSAKIRRMLLLPQPCILLMVIIFASCGTAGKARKSERKTGAPKPNIVLINVDDLGWKDVGFMGSSYYETPNIDELASEGLVFDNAYAGAANCAPSRACLISGLNSPRHGIYTVGSSERGNSKTRKLIPVANTEILSDTIYTLPQMLKDAGYVTGNFGKWHIGKDPHKQGMDVNIGGSDRGNPGRDGYFSPYNIEHIADGPPGEYLTDRLTTEAISFVRRNKDTSFFLYIPFYTVHTPLMGKDPLIVKFKNKSSVHGQDNPTYAAMIASLDENIGRILRCLKELQLVRNTIVIFTSDNGGVRAISSQAPLRAGKGSYYEGGIKVPLIIKWPGIIQPNTRTAYRVSHLDLFPTIQKIVGLRDNSKILDGADIRSLLQGKRMRQQDLFFHFPIYLEAYQPKKDDSRDPLFRTRPGSVIISGNWKLHHYYEDDVYELYDLKRDSGERDNLFDAKPKKAKEMQQKLQDWLRKTKAPIPLQENPLYDREFEKKQLDKTA